MIEKIIVVALSLFGYFVVCCFFVIAEHEVKQWLHRRAQGDKPAQDTTE